MYYLLADKSFAGGDLVQKSADNATAIAQGFNNLWNQSLSGPLYNSMCDLGILFAIATLTFFIVDWTRKMMSGDDQRAIVDLIWPLIVIVLLSNHGELLASSTFQIRNYINNTNNALLTQTAKGLDLRAAYQKAVGVEAARNAIASKIKDCQNSSLQAQEAIKCLQQAKADLTQKYPEYFNQNNGPFQWLLDRVDTVIQAPIDAIQKGENPLQIIFSPFSAMIGSNITSTITIVLLGLNGGYQWAIELTMLVTAYLGPLAVGGSLLPYGAKSIYTWLIGYFSVGMSKLCFNIIVGFAGQLITDSQSDQPMFFLFTIGIFAPFLATGLAAGGGLAVLQQINKAAETYSAIAIDAGKAVVTNGASLAMKFSK
jgi:glutaredoxin 2